MTGPVWTFLTVEDILQIHENQIALYGGARGVRDLRLLESAANSPNATFGGQLLNDDIIAVAASYIFHLCQNHPFIDGNKRTALASALVFLDLNGFAIEDDEEHLYSMMMDVASGVIGKRKIVGILQLLTRPKS